MSVQKLRLQYAATISLVFGLLLLGPFLLQQYRWLTQEVARAETLSILREVSGDLAQGHLWFEESVAGDPRETVEKWQEKFDHAEQGVVEYRESLGSHDQEVLDRDVQVHTGETMSHSQAIDFLASEIKDLRRLAEQRAASASLAGSRLDLDFDELNERADDLIVVLADDLISLSSARSQERLGIFRISQFIWISCVAGFVVLLLMIDRRRRRTEQEQEKLRDRFQQAQKLESLGVLAGGIAHDFNNLLMGVLGTTSMALLEDDLTDSLAAQLREIEHAARRSADLTSQLLAYAGKGKYADEPIEILDLIQDLEELLRVSLGPNVELCREIDEQLPLVEGNPTQLQQVLMNLIINGSDAMGEKGGRLTVRIRGERLTRDELILESQGVSEPRSGEYLVIEVEDQGVGMDPAAVNRCFEPFFTTKFTGRGLGLAAVVGIIRSHEGVIRVRSEVGVGTCFTVCLPAATGRLRAPRRRLSSDATLAGWGSLLVIDDDASVRNLVERMLIRCGYDVITAGSGREGAEVFAREHTRLRAVLVDMEMPGMTGVQVSALLRRIDPETPIILTSGYSSELFQMGEDFAGFIQKPYNIAELSVQLGEIFRGSAKGAEATTDP